jgi:hypothetical protein
MEQVLSNSASDGLIGIYDSIWTPPTVGILHKIPMTQLLVFLDTIATMTMAMPALYEWRGFPVTVHCFVHTTEVGYSIYSLSRIRSNQYYTRCLELIKF